MLCLGLSTEMFLLSFQIDHKGGLEKLRIYWQLCDVDVDSVLRASLLGGKRGNPLHMASSCGDMYAPSGGRV